MIKEFKGIYTDSLLLRQINEKDSDFIVNMRSDYEVYRYFKFPHKISLKEHNNWYYNNYLNDSDRLDCVCIKKDTNEKIGVFGLIRKNNWIEINYIIKNEFRHKGYAKKIIKVLLEHLAYKNDVEGVIAEIHKDNSASIKLVESLGFQKQEITGNFIIYKYKLDFPEIGD